MEVSGPALCQHLCIKNGKAASTVAEVYQKKSVVSLQYLTDTRQLF